MAAAISKPSRTIQCFLRDASCARINVNASRTSPLPLGAVSSLIQHTPTPPARRFYSPSAPSLKKAWIGSHEYKYWNREESKHGEASYILDMSPESIQREARIICLAADDDDANSPLTKPDGNLPFGSRLLHIGTQPTDFPESLADELPNVLFVSPSCPHARLQLPLILHKFPSIEWSTFLDISFHI